MERSCFILKHTVSKRIALTGHLPTLKSHKSKMEPRTLPGFLWGSRSVHLICLVVTIKFCFNALYKYSLTQSWVQLDNHTTTAIIRAIIIPTLQMDKLKFQDLDNSLRSYLWRMTESGFASRTSWLPQIAVSLFQCLWSWMFFIQISAGRLWSTKWVGVL